jgi:hypothetical protein
MLKLFEKCPACGGAIIITECKCADCQLVMRGEFQPSQLTALSDDHWTFIRAFLRARGNLSELEKVLGVSYPTIRNKLDEINLVLDQSKANTGATPGDQPTPDDARKAILQQVSSGVLTVAEAMQKLRNMQGGK